MALTETRPQFNGQDESAFTRWVVERIKYPAEAKANREQGRVVVSFVIDANGNLTDLTLLRGVSASLDQEALRVIATSPKWTPAYFNGKPIRVKINFPINFQLR